MKSCSLNDFMEELAPWLDKDHIKKAHTDNQGHFVVYFMDGMKNVYHIDDCNKSHINNVLKDLAAKGVAIDN